jgi:hypothetical protein
MQECISHHWVIGRSLMASQFGQRHPWSIQKTAELTGDRKAALGIGFEVILPIAAEYVVESLPQWIVT